MKLANLEDTEYQHKISAVSSFNPKSSARVSAFKCPLHPPAGEGERGEGDCDEANWISAGCRSGARTERWKEFCSIKQRRIKKWMKGHINEGLNG